jgi:hypothetical protein
MANELDKTIEELEAEVLDELEEANGNEPKAGATKMDKAEDLKDGVTGEEEIAGSTPDKVAPHGGVAATKGVKTDTTIPKKGGQDKIDTPNDGAKKVAKPLAAGFEVDGEEELSEMAKMTKAEMASKMQEMMKGAKKEQLMAMYNGMQKEISQEEMSPEDKEKKESVENRLKSIDVSEHVNALMNGEGDLSEEFKRKAATVFEAAVKSKVRSEVERMEDEYKSELEENINTTKGELTEKVDTYLNYVVEEWMKENELAIERGLKGEIAEDFISGLKQLFEDHYVDVPDEKYDVLEAQSEKISELEGRINEMMEEQIQTKSINSKLVKEQVMSEVSSDLAETEIEKFKSLIEDVDFTNEESYREKISTLKESYFPQTLTEVATETLDDVDTGTAQDIDTTDSMHAYMAAIGRTVKSAK